jgi:hypothetical protein
MNTEEQYREALAQEGAVLDDLVAHLHVGLDVGLDTLEAPESVVVLAFVAQIAEINQAKLAGLLTVAILRLARLEDAGLPHA